MVLTVASLALWLAILLLPWQPWGTSESLDAPVTFKTVINDQEQQRSSSITVLIPARNEGDVIGKTLSALYDQAPSLKIILIDDQSTDDTVSQASDLNLKNLLILSGKPLPDGWSGKLWALEQGLSHVETDLVLLLDADISLQPGTLATLCHKFDTENLDFLSLMAHLKMESFWEKLLMPAFIHFFKLLYPFKLSNNGHPLVAAAAGGCILLKRELLEEVGAFKSLRTALIDDCSLARKARNNGKVTWIGLTHSVTSHRSYQQLSEIWNMVARTAYTQLKYSPLLLVLCTLLMVLAYVIPFFSFFYSPWLGFLIVLQMVIVYLPVILYYNLPVAWVLGLPVAGILYLMMTWSSAYRFYRGERSQWKGRTYS